MHQLLSDEQRAQLATIASLVSFKKGAVIYRSGDFADAIFNVVSGVVKCRSGEDGDHIVAFLFPGDVFGLSAEGRYVSSAATVTPVTAYRLPVSALRRQLSADPQLAYSLICKLCQELRQSARHALLLARRRADSKIAAFLQELERLQHASNDASGDIHVPMDRTEIADYAGMSLEAVSRTFAKLSERGIIAQRTRRHVKIINRADFERIAAGEVA